MNDDAVEMIRGMSFDRRTLYQESMRLGCGRGAVEKDIVITIILAIIANSPEFHSYSGNLVFRGGTCIKKVFYPDETRFSEDLDFMGLTIDDANSFLQAVKGLARMELGLTSFEGTEVLYRNERGLDFMLYYTSVLQQKDHISFNIGTSGPMESIQSRSVNCEPYLQMSSEIPTLGIDEILAEKTRALLQRRKPRDVFDVWFLIKKKGLKLKEVLLRKKLERSYLAAPSRKKAEASAYIMGEIITRIEETVTDAAWKNELGGLLIKPKPQRLTVIEDVCEIISSMGDIWLTR